MNRIFTLGHSNGTQEELLSLLRLADINCVIDVRSVPASAYTPQFNKDPLSRFLKKNGVVYMHFGEEFGARRHDAYVNGQVNFEKAVQTPAFQRGVDRIRHGIEKGYRIAFMCSEANPLSCHRFAMVSRYFHDNGFDIQHILHSKEIVSHEQLEQQMIESYLHKKNSKLKEVDNMFGTYNAEQQREDAYRIKNEEIGYRPENNYENEI